MELKDMNNKAALLEISLAELLVLNNALNEVCNGLDQFEFEARMGASNMEVSQLLAKVSSIINSIESKS